MLGDITRSLLLLPGLVLQTPSAPSRPPIERTLGAPSHVRLVLELDPRSSAGLQPGALDSARRVLHRRLDEFGARDATVQSGPDERLVVEATGVTELRRLEWLLTTVGGLEFRITDMNNRFRNALPDIDAALRRAGVRAPSSGSGGPGPPFLQKSPAEPFSSLLFQGQLPGEFLVLGAQESGVERLLARPEVQRGIPAGIDLKWGAYVVRGSGSVYRTLYAVEHRPIIRGEEPQRAVALREGDQAVVAFTLSERGGRIFKRETGRHVNDYLAIILNGQVQGQPPIIRDPIGRRGQIELGDKPLAEAQALAAILTAGSLPAPLVLMDVQILGTSPPVREVGPWQMWAAVAAVVLWVLVLFVLARRRRGAKG